MKHPFKRWLRWGIGLIAVGFLIGFFGTAKGMVATMTEIASVTDGKPPAPPPNVGPRIDAALKWTGVGVVVSCIGFGFVISALWGNHANASAVRTAR